MSRNVVITGVSGGIGARTARRFSEEGAHVIGVDADPSGEQHCDVFSTVDLRDREAIRSFCEELRTAHKEIASLVHVAGLQLNKPIVETTPEEWDEVFATNVRSLFLLVRNLVDSLAGGSIVIVSSVHAKATSSGASAYAASKGALSSLTRSLAVELAEEEIRVNAVLPGAIDTDMLKEGLNRFPDPERAREQLVEATPLEKVGSPDDVAEMIAFLASPSRAGNVTGQEFVCDGGVLAQLASETGDA